MKSLLEDLREKTTDVHKELHKHPILLSCQQSRITVEEYRHMLKSFYKPWQKLIPNLIKIPQSTFKNLIVNRYNLLKSDLVKLKVENHFINYESDIILNEVQILGYYYVLLGSSMGSKLLKNKIISTLSDVPIEYMANTPQECGWFLLLNDLKNYDANNYKESTFAAIDAFNEIKFELSKFKVDFLKL